MDELLHHCLRELAFDGDLGSNVSRLKDFIVDFYGHANASHPQTPDDVFCAFVWSLVVEQPTVLVGLIDSELPLEVWIAPQISAKRKAKARGEDNVESSPPKLSPITEPKNTSLDTLSSTYGYRLRLAVEPDAIFAAITGSHIRSSKMSPMVYSALQIITRGRDAGVTVVELGKQSRYDQKTCFYLVRQLTELDLVVKVRRGGVGTHFCIHKYFFERSSSWKAIRDEENQAEMLQTRIQRPDIELPDVDEDIEDPNSLNFTPIDARHLSSLPLISGRVIRLLKASRNHIHASNNMLITLGFSNPTKTDRRFFQSRIREMIEQRLIDKVVVPSNRKKSYGTSVKCFRLVSHIPSTPAESIVAVSDMDDDGDDNLLAQNGVRLDTTIHKQIIDLLEESGTSGMSLNELSNSLFQFDKRTIELLLARADKSHPPPHLSDLRIASLMETSGRERRHRYFTVASFRKLVALEQLDKGSTAFDDVDLQNVGGFFLMNGDLFYDTEKELTDYCDNFKNNDTSRLTKAKKHPRKNPLLPDGQVKRGRPRKSTNDEGGVGVQVANLTPIRTLKRKRKISLANSEAPPTSSVEQPDEPVPKKVRLEKETLEESITAVKRKRGRPPKLKDIPQSDQPPAQSPSSIAKGTRSKRQQRNATGIRRTRNSQHETLEDRIDQHASHDNDPDDIDAAVVPVDESQPNHEVTEMVAPSDHLNKMNGHSTQDVHTSIRQNGTTQQKKAISIPNGTIGDGNVVQQTNGKAPVIMTVGNLSGISTEDPFTLHSPPRPDILLPSKSASTSASRVNVSHLRRENELLKLVENVGGILNMQTKEFYEGHMAILELLAQAGEPTSSPVGTKIDKRTATATFSSLEQKGRIKQLKTIVTTPTGINKPACVIYLPDVDQTKLNAFLAELAQASQTPASHFTTFVKIDHKVDYGAELASRGILPFFRMEQSGNNEKERWSKNVGRANQLFSHDDSTIREVFLAERTTIAQLYGFVVGKALRCRQLHLFAIQALQSQNSSPHIFSHEKRIIDLSFFCQDLSLEIYCSLVSPLAYDEELIELFKTKDGRETLVRELPQNIQTSLQIGRSRARSRFLDMLEILRSLGLATPLQPSTSATPFIRCSPSDQHPGFDLAPLEGWNANTPTIAPTYWYLNESAPIHLWAVSENRPPLWKNATVLGHADSLVYWDDLQSACMNPDIVSESELSNLKQSSSASIGAARSIRRSVSWKGDYFLTWHQTQYLKQFVDASSMSTPLQIPDDQERQNCLDKLCWVTSAPQEALRKYFTSARERLSKTLDRIKRKAKKSQKKRAVDAKISLAKKAESARLQREKEWTSLLHKVHPEAISDSALVRIERVRMQFMQSGSIKDVLRWETGIRAAFHEADLASSKGLKISPKRTPPTRQFPSHSTGASVAIPETSVQELIDLQGPPAQYAKVNAKRKRKQDSNSASEGRKQPRRHRFQWNSEYDELARDASAIIRARCRNLSRLDWAAFEQVFPSVPRNTVRQRLSHIKETPGNEAYLRRLEDTWYDLWIIHKGTPELPDDNDQSPSDFDLVKHIEFLRQRIDKDALRVGLAQTTETISFVLPSDLDKLLENFEVVQEEKIAPEWDFMWNALIEEGREKKLKRLVISRCPEKFAPSRPFDLDEIVLAESVLKMAMGTPSALYDPEQASSLLKEKGDESINTATKNLLSRGVLSKSQRDPSKQKPGRQLKISDANQNAIGGTVTRDTFQDAISLLEEIDPGEDSWHDWPLAATDGDCATLIELVSDDKVDFNIDTSHAQAARQAVDWNSKKTDDDQIETAISVRYRLDAEIADPSIEMMPVTAEAEEMGMDSGHGLSSSSDPACCRKTAMQGLVDCSACLSDAWSIFHDSLDTKDRQIADCIIDVVLHAGENGVQKSDVFTLIASHKSQIASIVNQMADADIPQIYWTGYDSLVLISAHYISKWTVAVTRSPIIHVFPRRWLDIRGNRVADFWQAALRAVMGLIVFRPGISHTEIRWRLRSVYDRQEVNEILLHLQLEGYLQVRLGITSPHGIFAPFGDEEESQAYWFIGEKHWYQV